MGGLAPIPAEHCGLLEPEPGRRASEAQRVEREYGPYSTPWSVTFDQPGNYYRTHVEVWLANTLAISEPADWIPEPTSNVDYYRKHFESVGTVRFPYPAPEETWSAASHSGWQVPDLEQFEITSVEKEIT